MVGPPIAATPIMPVRNDRIEGVATDAAPAGANEKRPKTRGQQPTGLTGAVFRLATKMWWQRCE
jgi:hypothetical protein